MIQKEDKEAKELANQEDAKKKQKVIDDEQKRVKDEKEAVKLEKLRKQERDLLD